MTATMRRPKSLGRTITRIAAILAGAMVAVVAFCRAAAANREAFSRSLAAPVSGHFVRADDVELFVQEDGPHDGPAVLLVHGAGAWSEIWRHTMDTLAVRGFHAVAVDMPPFGFSERPITADYSDEAQARRILAVMETLHLTQVTLVAHSFGGRPAMEAFFLDSSRVSRLVLVDAALGLGNRGAASPQFATRALLAIAPLRNALVSATLTNPALTARLLRGLVSNTSAVTPGRIEMLQRQFLVEHTTASLGAWLRPFVLAHEHSRASLRPLYEAIDVPTLVVWGESDSITPIAQGRDLARLIPGATLVELSGVGHIPAIEAPERFDAALMSFLLKK
jgi:pimeloyl-ACP methyl ester carboxylesterase